MKMIDFFNNYEFHDSLLNKIDFNKEKKTLSMNIELCNYEQKNYKEDDEETSIVDVVFSGCESYDGLSGNLNTHSILETVLNSDNQITFNVMDDLTNDYYELVVQANTVNVLVR